MSNIFDFFVGAERKKYNIIMKLIENKDYGNLLAMDTDWRFGLKNQKYLDNVLNRISMEVINNPELVLTMCSNYYNKAGDYLKLSLKHNPNLFEYYVENKAITNYSFTSLVLDYGYVPKSEFVNNHMFIFLNSISRLLDLGYMPDNKKVEEYSDYFKSEEIVIKLLDRGFIPSFKFIEKAKLFRNPNLVNRILDVVDINEDNIDSNIFLGSSIAQRRILRENPELLFSVRAGSDLYNQFCIEAFKMDYVPNQLLEDITFVNTNFSLFSRVIKQRPEKVKYCQLVYDEDKDRIDELALSMGYVPSINDAKNSKYIQRSFKLMKALIAKRPEAIKYAKCSLDRFDDLVLFALDNGYIPTLKDLETNEMLANNFEVMRILIKQDPNLITSISYDVPRKEDLLKVAIENGFNGNLYNLNYSNGTNPLITSETGIMYCINHGQKLDFKPKSDDSYYYSHGLVFDNYYSLELFQFLIDKGYKIDEIIHMFSGNYDSMKKIISDYPEYIVHLDVTLERNQIDELCFLAIEKGYVPKVEDKIFGRGSEICKYMVQLYPSYLEKIQPNGNFLGRSSMPSDLWLEICKISVDTNFMPDINTMGDGMGGSTITKYNSSYDIMKKAIAIKPSLIEACSVEDKELYDELCRLAISKGYEITSLFMLEHTGYRLCTNFDFMSRYVREHPSFISSVNIPDKNQMLQVIDIAIESGLKIDELSDSELLNIFLLIDEDKWSNYIDESKIISIKKAKELSSNNDEVSKTVIPKFLSDEITSHFTKSQIEILSCYPKLQEKILKLSFKSNSAKIIFELVNKYKNNLEWIPILESALDNVVAPEFANLLASFKYEELEENDKNNLFYLVMTNNHLDISSIDELKNIEKYREDYINMLINRNTVGSLKTAYFEKVYGIDLSKAIDLVNIYGGSLEGYSISSLDDKDKALFVILNNMKKIISINNIEVLKYYIDSINPEFIVKPDLMVDYEAKLKYLFTREFNKSFTKPLEEDRVVTNGDGEEDLDIFLAAGSDGKKKMRMMITSIGAYTNMEEPDDYYASWNVDKIASHGCCCSYVGEKNLGTAEVKYCCLGFTDYELGSLQLSGPYDLCSVSSKDSYQISAMFASKFLLPDDVLDYTRHTHNETVWERRSISDGMFKKQPSYIVYFVDNFDDRLTDEEAKRQWESVKKAASNFSIEVDGVKKPLPIMVVEREKIAKAQLDNIQTKLEEFRETKNSKLIHEIITDYESNYAGNRQFHPNISEKYFPQHENLSDSVVGQIMGVISGMYQSNPELAMKCVYELEKVINKEKEKYSNTKHGVGQSLPSFDIDMALDGISRFKSIFKISNDSMINVISNCNDNVRQYESSYASFIGDIQLSSEEVIKIINDNNLSSKLIMFENEITDEKINSNLKVNGQRHVKNVLLYSLLIGQEVVEDKHDLDLILLASKYHDIGRKTDAHEKYALSSAEIAANKLKDKCSVEDIAIIKSIIEFQDYSRYDENIDSFIEICRKNGVKMEDVSKVRKYAEVLKDADALDRTRFINDNKLNINLLKFDISKKLVRFSSSMQETYALEDLKEFHCEDEINILLEKFSPQEVIRTIRYNNKGNVSLENIQSFIYSWATSISSKKDELDEMFVEDKPIVEEGVKVEQY